MADESVIITPTKADMEALNGWRVTKWHQYDNYECIYCQFSSIFKPKIIKHMEEDIHVWAYPSTEKTVERADGTDPVY